MHSDILSVVYKRWQKCSIPIRTAEKNFRPVSIVNAFSKIYEKIVKEQISPFLEETLSVSIAAYRKAYGTQHVLVRMLEDWKTKLDNDFTVGAILMDLSKAFDCIPHDLLIAKLNAYGFNENSLVFIYSYLKRCRQSVRINNVYSNYQSVRGSSRICLRPYSFQLLYQ